MKAGNRMSDIFYNDGKHKINLSKIRNCTSDARLSSYSRLINQTSVDEFTLFPYMAIQTVTSMFYIPLQTLEICLRNLLHNNICEYYKGRSRKISLPGPPEKWYLWMPESHEAKTRIQGAIAKANKEISSRPITDDDIVSRFQFGTWIYILKERGSNKDPLHFWQGVCRTVFPNTKCKRQEIITTLIKLNGLRNRIFHHEPAWKNARVHDLPSAKRELESLHNKIWDVVYWMSEDLYIIYCEGSRQYKAGFINHAKSSFALCEQIKQDLNRLTP